MGWIFVGNGGVVWDYVGVGGGVGERLGVLDWVWGC